MAISDSTIAFVGTSESSGVTIANNALNLGTELDVLGNLTSTGTVDLYLVFTSTVTAGSIDVRVNKRRVSGTAYVPRFYQFSGTAPINGTQYIYLGSFQTTRYVSVDVLNNATGASATNVAVLGFLTQVS